MATITQNAQMYPRRSLERMSLVEISNSSIRLFLINSMLLKHQGFGLTEPGSSGKSRKDWRGTSLSLKLKLCPKTHQTWSCATRNQELSVSGRAHSGKKREREDIKRRKCSQTYANLGSDSKTAIGFTPVFSSAKENNIA